MKNQQVITDEIRLRLQAPLIALKRITAGRSLPGVFARAALGELTKAYQLLRSLEEGGKKAGKKAYLHKK